MPWYQYIETYIYPTVLVCNVPTSEAAVTKVSVAVAIGLWYAAQSHVGVLLQVAIVVAIGLVLPATYRRVTAPIPERPDRDDLAVSPAD